ncbi:MAG: phosphoribosylformylglycinamidine cyclo-ligase, partial [Clostridia bacterium]|nr:phosphoribosylformylglycinamidine cyclo-ligase [Clostridia bacterium]
LVRKVFGLTDGAQDKTYPELDKSLFETLLTPTRIYVKSILALLKEVQPKGICHITGGGFYENIPRALPEGLCAKIKRSDVRVLPIFDIIAREGNVPERDMFNTYNMGVGMTVTVDPADVEKALEILRANGEDAYVLGEVVEGEKGVELW